MYDGPIQLKRGLSEAGSLLQIVGKLNQETDDEESENERFQRPVSAR
jgi:hypothetical protein